MNENLNLVEILKDCPKGTKLYSTIFGEVKLHEVRYGIDICTICIENKACGQYWLTSDGRYANRFDGECTLFPSKEQRDWSKFNVKKPKFDPQTLQAFDKVLGFFNGVWNCDLYSHYYNDDRMFPYVCFRSCVNRVIPYNEETKHLVGTTEEAPKYYRYWEE